ALREHGVNRALVEFGGDIAVSDPPPGQRGWRVRLTEAAGAPPSLLVANAAISTSGDGAQFVDIEGERYSHVIDPRTGVALHDGVVATVIAARGRLSDPLATVLGVLGPEAAQPFLDRYFPDVRAYVRRIEYPGAPD